MARGDPKEEELSAWDGILIGDAVRLMKKRAAFIDSIGNEAARRYGLFDRANLHIAYAPKYQISLADLENDLKEQLQAVRQRELKAGVTLVGPHRDRLTIEINGRSLRHYGSRGQKRCAMIAIMLATANFISNNKSREVTLLLDETFAELDREKSIALLRMLGEFNQVFIATAGNMDLSGLSCRRFRVEKGMVREE